MSERTWEKYGAATGIAFGILLLVAVFMVPTPPHVDASASKIASFYAGHRHAVLASGVVGSFATIAAVLFISHLRHVFDRVEGGVEGDVTFEPHREADAAVDAAFHAKYDRYGRAMVGTVVSSEAVRSTLRVRPA